ncbi:MAG: hypothetical protein CMH81_00255 [Nitrospiraceae bacterium]|jgi:hypothetical protein|nr:hypothetical protein [Nitrospiraceae bacterium]|tara:strand:+ start:4573 stop:5148 length:576 start_codon:yes stop_codon:yes gene_type:complete
MNELMSNTLCCSSLRILALGFFLHLFLAVPAHSTSNDLPDWEMCLAISAKKVGVPTTLLHAIVDVESNGHPWAFGFRNKNGKWASRYLDDRQTAEEFLRYLWKEQLHFDAGLAQISSPNLKRFWKTKGISPLDALEPCTNLQLAAIVLGEQIEKHGYTWRAVAGYNGSVKYIPRVWKALCQRQPMAGCPRG